MFEKNHLLNQCTTRQIMPLRNQVTRLSMGI